MKHLVLLLAGLALCSSTQTQTWKPDYFLSIPAEIDGCSGFYTYTSVPLHTRQYIFITNLQEDAFIRLEGKVLALRRKSFSSHTYIYEGQQCRVTLVVKNSRQTGDEVWYETASLTVLYKGQKATWHLHGETGC